MKTFLAIWINVSISFLFFLENDCQLLENKHHLVYDFLSCFKSPIFRYLMLVRTYLPNVLHSVIN